MFLYIIGIKTDCKHVIGWLGRVGDSTQRNYTSDWLHGAEFRGGICSVCKQRCGRKSSAETQGKNRTQVGLQFRWEGRDLVGSSLSLTLTSCKVGGLLCRNPKYIRMLFSQLNNGLQWVISLINKNCKWFCHLVFVYYLWE